MILIETGILILHLRRRQAFQPASPATEEIRRLAALDAIVGIPGMALQEVLAGATNDASFQAWVEKLTSIAQVVPATAEDHEFAGRLASFCRRKGVTTGAPDALMAAQAIQRRAPLFAVDGDYDHIHGVYPLLRLHRPGDAPEEIATG